MIPRPLEAHPRGEPDLIPPRFPPGRRSPPPESGRRFPAPPDSTPPPPPELHHPPAPPPSVQAAPPSIASPDLLRLPPRPATIVCLPVQHRSSVSPSSRCAVRARRRPGLPPGPLRRRTQPRQDFRL
ncbi:hypothetical protein PVAP13_4NG283438 [Panicum virgatum]|uniref:Uncharacterized protein n=1 Tax=Panicum virgatum TaxID=38727 RepID=A0A8T0TGU7_PANVG|nr:hypothetical protein PVAP13_4NG283438 [Panicum virgatum]